MSQNFQEMVNFENLPAFIVSVVLKDLDFNDFANAFKVWMHGKSAEDRVIGLSGVDIGKYYDEQWYNHQFRSFINYALNLGVGDADYFLFVSHLVQKSPYVLQVCLMHARRSSIRR